MLHRFTDFFKKKEKVDLLTFSLQKSKKSFFDRVFSIFSQNPSQKEAFLLQTEELLLGSDFGFDLTARLLARLDQLFDQSLPKNTEAFLEVLRQELSALLIDQPISFSQENKMQVILIVGINGVGKTTSIAKLAHFYQSAGKKVLLGAADTFRAAAAEQLQVWADRLGIGMVRQQAGADPASVAFDTLQSAKAKGADVVIIDTAGRLHNNTNLMKELEHIKKVIQKFDATAPHEVLLILDSTTGQNALAQAEAFSKATQVTGLFLTKLDNSARGGVVFAIADRLHIPIAYLGVGEKKEDLLLFDKDRFLDLFFEK